jgi:DNA-binding NarL/FixJ family response regulator
VTNIIIADDHAVVRQGVKQILAAETDMRVVGEAKNFGETLAVVRDLDWDVLILDYSMPGGNGLQVLKKIQKSHPKRPVLILSMHPEEAIAVSALRAGAAGVIRSDLPAGLDQQLINEDPARGFFVKLQRVGGLIGLRQNGLLLFDSLLSSDCLPAHSL